MENVQVISRTLLRDGQDVICPVEPEYAYENLDPQDYEVLFGAADCLADTFAGTSVDGVRISEPMTNACLLSRKDMFDFTVSYINSVAYQRLCYVARDKQIGRVIGAIACEDFDPDEEAPFFEGRLEPMNTIISFLLELDRRFIDTIEFKTGKRVGRNEYVHAFMAGSRLGSLKRFVIIKLLDLLIKDARMKEYKGIFVEATNIRSAKLLTDYCGFHPVFDRFNTPIQTAYADHAVFKAIPPAIAIDCKILYKPLFREYDI